MIDLFLLHQIICEYFSHFPFNFINLIALAYVNMFLFIFMHFFQEHHLQRAICTGLIIPTPEVYTTDQDFYDRNYPPNYRMPRQLIHMQRKNIIG